MFYVPRKKMPQIDEKDLPHLVKFTLDAGHDVTFEQVKPDHLRAHQRVNHTLAKSISGAGLLKPALVSFDDYVLDGNHRWWAHKYQHDPLMNVIRLGLPFDKALDFLFTFPATFAYGDGRVHPITM